jgi:hypothetical protein
MILILKQYYVKNLNLLNRYYKIKHIKTFKKQNKKKLNYNKLNNTFLLKFKTLFQYLDSIKNCSISKLI